MNTLRFKQLFLISGLAGILVTVAGRSTHAESLSVTTQPNQPAATAIAQTSPSNAALTAQVGQSHHTPTSVVSAETVAPPTPAETSATSLQIVPQTTAQVIAPQDAQPEVDTTVAQAIDPGRATRSGSSYIGIGGNIGFGGDSGLGTGNFAVISKVGLTRNFSLRPSALVGDGATFLLPVTVDFPIAVSTAVGGERIGAAPYIGGGVSIPTDSDTSVQPLVTAGVDVPISDQFTANASANVSFPDDTEVGIILGIGYNF